MVRNVLVAFVGSLLAAVVVLGAYVGGRRYFTSCPCGFIFNSQANGCIVDIYNRNPCPDQGGGNPGGGSGDEFRKKIEGDIKVFADVVKAANLKFEE